MSEHVILVRGYSKSTASKGYISSSAFFQRPFVFTIIMPKPTIEFTPALSFPEEDSSSKHLSVRTLSHDTVTGDKTTLLTHAPGSSWGGPVCEHLYWEECYLISGRLYDEGLKKWFSAGDYCCRPPGMLHGPFRADETEGCREICWLKFESPR